MDREWSTQMLYIKPNYNLQRLLHWRLLRAWTSFPQITCHYRSDRGCNLRRNPHEERPYLSLIQVFYLNVKNRRLFDLRLTLGHPLVSVCHKIKGKMLLVRRKLLFVHRPLPEMHIAHNGKRTLLVRFYVFNIWSWTIGAMDRTSAQTPSQA